MTGTSHQAVHAVPEAPKPPEPTHTRSGARRWLLRLLDSFLSDHLRSASPSELVRSRVLVGATLFLLVLVLSYVLVVPLPIPIIAALFLLSLGWAAALLMAREARSHTPSAVLFCATNALGFLTIVFISQGPYIGIHTGHMLVPALAVYLMGPRLAGILTGLFALGLGVLHPLYFVHAASLAHQHLDPNYLPLRVSAGVFLLGSWIVGSLHSTARDEAQASLEHTLQHLRDSERKLSSLIESTDDPIVSMDTQGRVLTANVAALRIYQKRFGRPLEKGRPLVDPTHSLMKSWQPRMARVLQGHAVHFEEEQELGDSRIVLDIRINPILGDEGKVVGLTLFARDITHRKEAEARLGEMHRTLLDVSRQAGMAEIATGVLHNVGNTLNSVNVSTGLLAETLHESRVTSLAKAVQLLREHSPDLSTFLTTDPQGKNLPDYLLTLSKHLVEEREVLSKEVRALTQSVEHIRAIVSMQQQQARGVSTIEQLQVPRLIDEALRLHAISLDRLGISVQREYAEVPLIHADRHKLLQILVNLLTNARQALVESARHDRRLTIRVQLALGGQRLLIEVADNGVGIAPENLPRLFTQGFTTKATGHGFGLHISALTAADMRGQLRATSPGSGLGATFTLELPLQVQQA